MSQKTSDFIDKWSRSEASERANKDGFLYELCDVLAVGRPEPATGNPKLDSYVFEAPVKIPGEAGTAPVGFIDLYKKNSFVLEAKQGSSSTSKKIGTARRGTSGWTMAMQEARGQALKYAMHLDEPPPFLIVCDIGYCFDVFATFDGTTAYREFPTPQSFRLFFNDFEKHKDLLRGIFVDPLSLDPSKQSIKVTREVAVELAKLSKSLEADGHHPELVATFLMRCIFTMFAEDVGLLPNNLFTHLLSEYWIKSPASFSGGVMGLWKEMNVGGQNVICGKLLKFNGGLFKDPQAPKLSTDQLEMLLNAAKYDWADVEPAIFGTLIERALNAKERHALGAHFTPKAYVERLVRPTIEEPLRADWDVVKAHVRQLISAAEEKNIHDKDRVALNREARQALIDFHTKLCSIKVLDPACGSGNFLYVTLEILKRLEGEVLVMMEGIGGQSAFFEFNKVTVNPSQFLGIEIKPWSKEIAELVLWIGYLQWHVKNYYRRGKKMELPEPILQDYKNIECRDAVLAYDKEELLRDEKGMPVSQWDGETMKKHPFTGEDVPDECAQKPVYRYIGPRKAEWPEADFIVGNPPFIGSKRMRVALGDGYVDALRPLYRSVPDGTDFVLYWWTRAAELVCTRKIRRYGFITTNSITQSMNRKATENALFHDETHRVLWAIPDHPWVDSVTGAAVRIAMTVVGKSQGNARLLAVLDEQTGDGDEILVKISERSVSVIHSDLRAGAPVASAQPLRGNIGICSVALVRFGEGFLIEKSVAQELEEAVVHPILTGRDLNQSPAGKFVIDFYPMDEHEARETAPRAFQHVLERVKPGREQIRDPGSRQRWWRFGRDKPELRQAIYRIDRYIATSEVSKNRVFSFVPANVRPDHSLVVVASNDAFLLGILSSRIHLTWALAAGGTLEDRPRYNKTRCFEPFPFPVCDEQTKNKIRSLAESLDAHRKKQQAAHSKLTMTGMYNVLEKLRSGEELSTKDRGIHEQGLVSVLKKIHDDLDDAVFDAYGWPRDLTDEDVLERLVALNQERAEEENNGLIRWLRPEYQTKVVKGAVPAPEQPALKETEPKAKRPSVPPAKPAVKKKPWPKTLPERIVAIRDLISSTQEAWTAETVARSFTRGQVKTTIPVLESLTAVGVLFEYKSGDTRVWRANG